MQNPAIGKYFGIEVEASDINDFLYNFASNIATCSKL